MLHKRKNSLFAVLACLAIVATACGGAGDKDTIATAVEMTVQARLRQATPTFPATATPGMQATGTPITLTATAPAATQARPTFPVTSGADANCGQASLVSETI